jgi:hypothetical protein
MLVSDVKSNTKCASKYEIDHSNNLCTVDDFHVIAQCNQLFIVDENSGGIVPKKQRQTINLPEVMKCLMDRHIENGYM